MGVPGTMSIVPLYLKWNTNLQIKPLMAGTAGHDSRGHD